MEGYFFLIAFFSGCQKKSVPLSDPLVLLRCVSQRHLHPLAEGEYRRGEWEVVETSRPPSGIRWTYPWGVTLYGLLRVGEVLQDSTIIAFVLEHNRVASNQFVYLDWQRRRFGRYVHPAGLGQLMTLGMLDYCGSMTNQLLEGVLRYRGAITPQTDTLIAAVADYIRYRQDRLPDGTFCRVGEDTTLWADDLYNMGCPFLVRYAVYANDPSALEDAARQIVQMGKILQDEDGLWFHGYFVDASRVSGYKWCRANGWVMVATVEVLSALPKSHPYYDDILAIFRRHIEGIQRVQASSGRWHQVLDHPELWEETSSTVMFLYALCRALDQGWIGQENRKTGPSGLSRPLREDYPRRGYLGCV